MEKHRVLLPDDLHLVFRLVLKFEALTEQGFIDDLPVAKIGAIDTRCLFSCLGDKDTKNNVEEYKVVGRTVRAVRFTPKLYFSFLRDYIEKNATLVIGGAVSTLWAEACAALLMEFPNTQSFFDTPNTAIKKLQEYEKHLVAKRKSRGIALKRGGDRRTKANLSQLSKHYDHIIGQWEEALSLCRQALDSKSPRRKQSWKEDIERDFPEFPQDLIGRLPPMSRWEEQTLLICSEKGGQDKAEDIALEHSARLCGAKPYAYKLSTLLKKIQRARKRENQSKT